MMADETPVLIINGQLKGKIFKMQNPGAGIVNVEPVEPLSDDEFAALTARYHQVHYRGAPMNLFENRVFVGWCGPTKPGAAELAEVLLSDLAKQLVQLAAETPAPVVP